LRAKDIHHDIYAIGTQECQRSIATSVIVPSKAKWEALLKSYLGDKFVMVSGFSLGATHLAVFIHIKLIPIVENVKADCIATGI
jgi:phosphatidylinositol-bisphosphatase